MHQGNVLASSCSCIVALVVYKVATELNTFDLMKADCAVLRRVQQILSVKIVTLESSRMQIQSILITWNFK